MHIWLDKYIKFIKTVVSELPLFLGLVQLYQRSCAPELDNGRENLHRPGLGLRQRSKVLLRIEACGDMGINPRDAGTLLSEPLTLWRGKGKGIVIFLKKKKNLI